MAKQTLEQHLQDEIDATRKQHDGAKMEKNKAHHALKLSYLESLQRYIKGAATREDAALADVLNDMLQSQGVLASNQTFRDLKPAS